MSLQDKLNKLQGYLTYNQGTSTYDVHVFRDRDIVICTGNLDTISLHLDLYM